ncbi:MAG: DNA polymerase III subunit gamma/tau [Coprobacillus sp.]|nr:DNA polymerase III subunit gamma/tau [Coprobacillus sp.]
MAYKALYRTYRPLTFDEVAGQEHIVKTLKNALERNKLAHAYLFAGPRGTGKTTMARLLAKALNCDEGVGHQCNHCKNCLAINEGTHPDVIEIDAASNSGVDNVRDLIDKVKYGTILGRYKVYIIDEVHMMTPSAFNALLKTLEEPPANVVFILATTEPNKVLPTILSRCQRYDFTKLSEEEISNRLIEVLQKEKIEYNREAVDLIVSLADGGMRDALSILDQVLAYSSNTLKAEDIVNIFSLETKEEKISLLKDIANGDVASLLERMDHYFKKGTDIKRLTDDILVILKDLLIYNNTGSTALMQALNYQDAMDLSSYIRDNKTMEYIDSFMEVTKDYKSVSSINPLFEICVLKLASKKKPKAAETIVMEKEEEEPKVEERVFKEIVIEEKPKPEVKIERNDAIEQPDLEHGQPKILKGTREGDSFTISTDRLIELAVLCKNKETKSNLIAKWTDISKFVGHPEVGKIATILLDGRPLIANKDIVVLEMKSKSLVSKVNLVENQAYVQDILNAIFGRHMFVFALSREESVAFQQQYTNRQQLDKLPKPGSIQAEFEGE